MICEIPRWIIAAFLCVGPVAFILSIIVMQGAGHDEINKKDPQWIQWLRRLGFLWMASDLVSAEYFAWTTQVGLFVIFMFLLVLNGTYSLLINAIALRLRRVPPNSGSGAYGSAVESYFSLLREDLRGLDRGQLLTHLLLLQIFNDQNLKPDPAIVESAQPAEVVFPARWRSRPS